MVLPLNLKENLRIADKELEKRFVHFPSTEFENGYKISYHFSIIRQLGDRLVELCNRNLLITVVVLGAFYVFTYFHSRQCIGFGCKYDGCDR